MEPSNTTNSRPTTTSQRADVSVHPLKDWDFSRHHSCYDTEEDEVDLVDYFSNPAEPTLAGRGGIERECIHFQSCDAILCAVVWFLDLRCMCFWFFPLTLWCSALRLSIIFFILLLYLSLPVCPVPVRPTPKRLETFLRWRGRACL